MGIWFHIRSMQHLKAHDPLSWNWVFSQLRVSEEQSSQTGYVLGSVWKLNRRLVLSCWRINRVLKVTTPVPFLFMSNIGTHCVTYNDAVSTELCHCEFGHFVISCIWKIRTDLWLFYDFCYVMLAKQVLEDENITQCFSFNTYLYLWLLRKILAFWTFVFKVYSKALYCIFRMACRLCLKRYVHSCMN